MKNNFSTRLKIPPLTNKIKKNPHKTQKSHIPHILHSHCQPRHFQFFKPKSNLSFSPLKALLFMTFFIPLPPCCGLTSFHLWFFPSCILLYFCFLSVPFCFSFLSKLSNQTYPILFLPNTFILLPLTFIMRRPNINGCLVNEWRQRSHEILFDTLINPYLVSNYIHEASSTPVYFLSHLIVFRLLENRSFPQVFPALGCCLLQ